VHAVGGNVLEYYDLARALGRDQPFYGLQAKGLDGKDQPHTSIRAMATQYISEMRDVQPEGPYLLGGRSSGGCIAFEMACQLKAAGEEVALLALLDAYPAGYFKLLPRGNSFAGRLQRQLQRARAHLHNLRQFGVKGKLTYLATKLKYAPDKLKHKAYARAYKLYRRIGRPLPPVLQNIEELTFMACREYVPQRYDGRATLFSASDLTASYDVEDGWRQLVAELHIHQIPGNHLDIIKEPHVHALAEKMRDCMDAAETSPSGFEGKSYAKPDSQDTSVDAGQHWHGAGANPAASAVALGDLRASAV
jgi:thioesterase domain-containing protein